MKFFLPWLAAALLSIPAVSAGRTEYVFLVTGDGIRWQEVFTGADPALMAEANKKSSGIDDLKKLRAEFWDENPSRRREMVMPYFWRELSKHGIILGNRAQGSEVNLRNPHHFSYPGYAEILNGQPLEAIASNDPVWSPRETLPEFLRREFRLAPEKSAVFGSWNIFNWIAMRRDGEVFCNAGYEAMPEAILSGAAEEMRRWNAAQLEVLSPWNSVRHDAITLGLALAYVPARQPKFFYLALGETDDWAHDRRYDRTIQSLRYFDLALERLWTLLQASDIYRGKTTLVITTDHGRGRTLEDWTSHNSKTPGADETWIAIFGPDTPPRGELSNTPKYSQANIAATILKLYGIEPQKFNPAAAGPVLEALAAH